MMRLDTHTHSMSPDAGYPMEEMCKAALEQGLSELVVTDHFELFPPTLPRETLFDQAYLERYRSEYSTCRSTFAGKLDFRFGLELGQPVCNPELARRILQDYPFDYIIGSAHKVDGRDFSERDYSPQSVPAVLRDNLELLWQMADEGDFDCLGHIDLIRRYSRRAGREIDLMSRPGEVRQILARLVQRGKGLEINTSEVRRGGRPMPDLALLTLYREVGGEIVTFGSDAHCPQDVGAGFDCAVELIRAAGLRFLAHYHSRIPEFMAL